MKILHVIPGLAPNYGGPSQAIVEMCQALQSEGVEVLIATTDADGRGRLAVEIGTPVVYEGVPTIFFPRQLSEAFKYSHLLARWLDKNVEYVLMLSTFMPFSLIRVSRRHVPAKTKKFHILSGLWGLLIPGA